MTRRRYRIFALIFLSAVTVLVLASRVYPRIHTIHISGYHHLSALEVTKLLHVKENDPLLWVSYAHARALLDNPWVHSATLIRRLPHTLDIEIIEQIPAFKRTAEGLTTYYAMDGTMLKGLSDEERRSLPSLNGWGRDRTAEAITLLQLFAPYQPQMIHYSPNGLEVTLRSTKLFIKDISALKQQWGAILHLERHLMASSESLDSAHIAVHPWGVSVR